MDVRGALLEGVLQQPVDDVHHVAIVGTDLAALAQLHQLLEVEDRRGAVAPGLGVLGKLDRALNAVELLLVAVDVERAGDNALDVPPQHVCEVGRPAVVERFAGGERHLAHGRRDRQDAVPFRVGQAHHLGDRGCVDLHRIDLEVRQAGMAGQPLGQRLQAQRPTGLALVDQLGVGDHHQRVQLHRAAAGARAHAHVLRILGERVTVDHQRGQHLVQFESATTAEQRGNLWRCSHPASVLCEAPPAGNSSRKASCGYTNAL